MDSGQLPPQVLGDLALVGRLEVGEEEADGDRLGPCLADQLGQARRLVVGKGVITPSGPTRSEASNRISGSTSGGGFGVQSR